MGDMNIPTQEMFFFEGKWSSNVDDLILTTAVGLKAKLPWIGTVVPEQVINAACSKIQQEVGFGFTPFELSERIKLLETRYRTFKAVVANNKTWWDTVRKKVEADDCVWKQFFKMHPFAEAYYHKDEPEFLRLAILFGLEDVKVEVTMNNAIIVSDSTEHHPPIITIESCEFDDTEEVNSPAYPVRKPVRRKLFDADADSLDRESTNRTPPPHYYVQGPGGGLIRKAGFPDRKHDHYNEVRSISSPGGSSCASCSPYRGGGGHGDR